MKNYGVVLGLARNPKTPPAMSMQMLNRLDEKDVKMLAVDRNVPEALRLAARRLLGQVAQAVASHVAASSPLPPNSLRISARPCM